ncbi:MAG: hypothetical protein ACMUIE_07900, partial [Thermoplasmatota archaeon]
MVVKMRPVRSLFLSSLLVLTVVLSVPLLHGQPPSRADGNDTFETADEIIVSVDPWGGTLDPVDNVDYMLINGLEGDNENDQLHAQRLTIGLLRTSGANIKAVIYEPNRLELATLVSAGTMEELEFIVPRDGGFYIKITTDPQGQSGAYEIYLGGETGVDNREKHDLNNVPPGSGITYSVNIANSLDPYGDLVDYWELSIPGYRALELTLLFLGDLPFVLQVLDPQYNITNVLGKEDQVRIYNNGSDIQKVIARVFIPLSNSATMPVTTKPYNMDVVIWSHLTKPQINPSDPWTVRMTNEDRPMYPNINLTSHFSEPNGDPIEFEMISEPENLDVELHYSDSDPGDPVYVEVSVVPHPNWFGTEELTFSCSDRDGSVTDSVEIIVNSVNDLPYITRIGNADYEGGTFYMYAEEDIPKAYTITYGDDDDPIESIHFTTNETLEFLEVNPDNGTVTIEADQEQVGLDPLAGGQQGGDAALHLRGLTARREPQALAHPPHVGVHREGGN